MNYKMYTTDGSGAYFLDKDDGSEREDICGEIEDIYGESTERIVSLKSSGLSFNPREANVFMIVFLRLSAVTDLSCSMFSYSPSIASSFAEDTVDEFKEMLMSADYDDDKAVNAVVGCKKSIGGYIKDCMIYASRRGTLLSLSA